MATDRAYLRAVSLHLSSVLDEVGLNKLTVRKRRRSFLFIEHLKNLHLRLNGKKMFTYHFGSQIEGATTPGTNSDIDKLICHSGLNVIQDWSDWQYGAQYGQVNLLMLQDGTAPGYCRLQLLKQKLPMAMEEVPSEFYTYDDDGRVLLKNTTLNTHWLHTGIKLVRNGPALTQIGDRDLMDRDFVLALLCKYWPTQAEEFIRRHRRYGWPSHNLLQEAIKQGFFLVAVGYKLSPTEPLEWRISASLAERCLMFSLDTVHIKCLVVLKMLVKTFIQPHAKKCISSYHCKTAIFYSVENTEPGFWRDDNLLQCVTHCLTMLLTWATDGFCPQFVIADENLFAGKVTAQNKHLLQSIIEDLIKSNGRALLRVHIDDLGLKLQRKFSTKPTVMPILPNRQTLLLIGKSLYAVKRTINELVKRIIVHDKNKQHVIVIRSVYRKIVMCKSQIRHSEKYERQANEVFLENLSRWMGSLLASLSLSNETRVPRMAIQLLRVGTKYDVAAMLKLASVFYIDGGLSKADTLLRGVEHHVSSNIVLPVCACYNKVVNTPKRVYCNRNVWRGYITCVQLFSYCVRFSPQEIHCAPPALRIEFFRSVGDDLQKRDPELDDWMDLAAVDCLPFMYYLQYMTYRQLGNPFIQKQSLRNLERCLREGYALGHLETGWNLLGQCYELEQEHNAALACYKRSLAIRPRNNAANWHVAILCYRVINTC